MAIELATGYVSVVPSAKDFGKKLRDETDGPSRKAGESAGDEFSGAFGSSLKKLAAVAAAAFAGLQVGQFLKGSIDAASDLAESTSKVGVVFGDSADEIKDWAKTSATAMGQSQQAALEAAGTLGNLFVALKLPQPEAAKMSKRMVELAGDLASFNNVSPEEALEALRAGLVGETEPLRRFGVNLNDATLKAKALELGLSDGKATLDANAKAQAAYALILEQTSVAQGDFARTSEGFANQQRIMSAQWTNLKASIGDAFLPVAVEASQVVTKNLMPAFQRFSTDVAPKIADAIAGVIDKLGEVPDAVRAMVKAFRDGGTDITSSGLAGKFEEIGLKLREVVDFVKANEDVFKPLLAGVAGLAAAMAAAAAAQGGLGIFASAIGGLGSILPLLITPVGLFVLAIGALAAAAVLAYQKFEPFRQAVDSVVRVFREQGFRAAVDEAGVQMGRLWGVVKPKIDEFITLASQWLKDQGPVILRGLRDAWLAFADFMVTEFWPYLLGKLTELLAALGGWIVGTAWPWLKQQLMTWASAFANWVDETAWPWIQEKLPVFLGNLLAWIRDTAWPLIAAQLLDWARAFSDWVETSAVPWLKEKLPIIFAAIQSWMTNEVLPGLRVFAMNMARELLQFAVETALRMPGYLAQVTGQLIGWAVELMFKIPQMIFNVGVAIGQGLLTGIGNGIGAAWDNISGIGGRIVEAIIAPIRAAWNKLRFNIPSIDVPFLGKVGGISVGVTPIATGGLVTGPLLSLVGEAGPEAVIPLKKIQGIFDVAMANAGGGATTLAPTINIYAPLGVDRTEVIASVQQGLRQYDAARRGTRG